MAMTSVTFPAAMANLIPALTFMLAVIFKLENLNLGELEGKLKAGGTFLGIGGAMILTFYKGPEIPMWSTHFLHIHRFAHSSSSGKQVSGSLFSVGSVVSYSIWFIIQAKMTRSYPCYFSSTALTLSMYSIQSVVFALCTVSDWTQWKLGWDIRLFSVIYSGVVASGVMITLMAWVVKVRGPLFASVFSPVGLVFITFTGSVLLNEKLHLGSVIGGVLIAIGLYFVLWGKSREMREMPSLVPPTTPSASPGSEARSGRKKWIALTLMLLFIIVFILCYLFIKVDY